MNKYWFRKRRGLFSKDLGYGWVPITLEGGVSVTVFILIIIVLIFLVARLFLNSLLNSFLWHIL